MKIKLIATTKNISSNIQLENINQTIEKLKELISKMNSNTLTEDELYNTIIRLYHIGEGPHGKTEILLNSQKYRFQFLKTNITITNQVLLKNKKTNETSAKTFYYPCIIKVATLKHFDPNHYFTIEEITDLIKKREIVLWDIVWPSTNFDPNNKYTKDALEGYTDFNLYNCIYPSHTTTISQNEINKLLKQYGVQDKKMNTLKSTTLEQYKWILSFIKTFFTKEQLEKDKKELEKNYKQLLKSLKTIIVPIQPPQIEPIPIYKKKEPKKKSLKQKEHLLPQSQ